MSSTADFTGAGQQEQHKSQPGNESSAQAETKKALIRYLLQQVQQQQLEKTEALQYLQWLAGAGTAPAQPAGPQPGALDDIAIVGLACRFPDADDKTMFWQNLCAGKASLQDFPAQRLADLQAVMDDEMPLFQGGFLSQVDAFDPEAFGISPQAAVHMDPYQRLMLQVLVETIEDAGYQRSDFYNQPVGVYIGNDHTHRLINNYLHFIAMQYRDFQTMTGSWTGLLAGRLSYLLNLRGPAQVIDTSCSSALVALDAAIKAIRAGDCQQALVGGINLIFLPGKNVVGEVENEDTRVCTFADSASGTVWGEGVAAVLIKPLSAAIAAGDDIYGVVKGIAVNCDGASNGITAPSARAQQEVVMQCWQRAGVSAEQISYVEAHGTGTALGDPIEVKALLEAFASQTRRRQFCGIGSVKTNIGHTVGASGLASLIKVLLAMQYRQLPPSLNFDTPNRHIDFSQSPLYVQDRLSHWQGPQPLTAGVSAFGLIGTNAHLLVQQAPDQAEAADAALPPATPQLLVFSARTDALLLQSLQRYRDFLRQHPVSLVDLSFTLAVGRSHHGRRLALLSHSQTELLQQLDYLLLALSSQMWRDLPAGVWPVSGPADKTALSQHNRQASSLLSGLAGKAADVDDLAQLASCYLAGAQVKWPLLFAGHPVRRLHLPAQPLLAERYWFVAPDALPHTQTASEREAGRATVSVRKHRLTDLIQETDTDTSALYPLARQSQVLPAGASLAERVVAHVIAETLGYPQLQLGSNFYALGGDSIAGTRIVYMLNAMLGIKAELSDLLASDSLADFVSTLTRHRGLLAALAQLEPEAGAAIGGAAVSGAEHSDEPQAGSAANRLIARQSDAPDYPLSHAQRRMYLQTALSPDSIAYNATAIVELAMLPTAAALQQALLALLARHSSLRSCFICPAGDVTQVRQQVLPVSAIPTLPFWQLDLTTEPGAPAQLLQQVFDQKVQPYALDQAPLWQLGLIMLGGNRQFLLLDMHHIITDGASMGILLRELLALLSGAGLPALPLDYHDYAVYDVAQRDTPAYLQAKAYWLQKFSRLEPGYCQLETDYPRPALRDFQGACWHDSIPAALSRALRELAVAQRCSLFVLLLSAFRVLLYRLGAGSALSIGTPVGGRVLPQLQPLVGMFVNTLVLHEQLDATESFTALLARVKANTLADFDQQHFPYEDLTEALAPQHSPDRNPLFDICFVLNNQDMALGAADLLQDVRFDSRIAKFDLTLMCRDNQGVLECTFEYATALFSPARIRQLAQLWQQLLKAVVASPDTALAALELCPKAQQQALLRQQFSLASQLSTLPLDAGSADTALPAPASDEDIDRPRSAMMTLFASQVAARPTATALCYGDSTLTYQQLSVRVDALAVALRQLKLSPRAQLPGHPTGANSLGRGEPVALWFAPGVEMVVALLAVLRAGAAYLPLDLANPPARLQAILADSQSRLLLCANEAAAAQLQAQLTASEPVGGPLACQIRTLDQLSVGVDSPADTADLPTDLTGEDLAYLMYTSGTTGVPKGVLIRQQSVVRVVCDTNYLQLGPDDVCLLLANYAFDGSVFDLFGALLNGGTLVLCDKDDVLDPARVAALVSHHRVSSMFATTSLFNLLLDEQTLALCRLRYFIFGGEAASPRHCARALAHFAPGALINVYGPTEATVLVTAKAIHQQHPLQPVPIGQPVNDTRLYIFDSQRQLVPFGWTGELYIGGLAVAAGYLGQAQFNADKFIDNPYRPGERLYRSGDLVRWQQNGDLQFIGRVDNQVKIRGFRLELAEIEAALLALPEISQAQVMLREQDGRKLLVAAVVPAVPAEQPLIDSAQQPSQAQQDRQVQQLRQLQQALSARLPDYMLPAGWLLLAQFPLTANGKVDQRALSQLPLLQVAELPESPELSADAHSSPAALAQQMLEQDLLALWRQLLQVGQLTRHDNFFRVGGDSILAIQLVSQLRQLGYQLQVRDLFAAPTVAQFAAVLTNAAHRSSGSAAQVAAEQGLLSGTSGLLPVQQWFFDLQLAAPGHFNQSFRLYLPAALPLAQLQAALAVLTARHDMLRVVFVPVPDTGSPGRWQAQFLPDHQQSMAPVAQIDCSAFVHHGALDELQLSAALNELQQHFDYQHGPLWRVVQLVNLPDGSARLLLAFHHLVIDAVSWRILATDLTRLLSADEPPALTQLPAKTSSYRQWVELLGQYPRWFSSELSYWQQQLAAASTLPALPGATAGAASHASFTLSLALTQQLLREAPAGFNSRIDDLLLTALLLALQQTLGCAALLVNLEGHGREAELLHSRLTAGQSQPLASATAQPAEIALLDLSETVGWFTLAYPVLLQLASAGSAAAGAIDVAASIVAIKEQLRAVPNKGLGYGAFVSAGLLPASVPLAVSFNYLGQFGHSPHGQSGVSQGESEATPTLGQLMHEPCGEQVASVNQLPYLLDINAAVTADGFWLSLRSRWSADLTGQVAAALQAALVQVITTACQQAAQGGVKTASDFALAALSSDRLAKISQRLTSDAADAKPEQASSNKRNIIKL